MRESIKKKWIEALRSGKYKQGRNELKNEKDEMCCLGVLCQVYKEIVKKKGIGFDSNGEFIDSEGNSDKYVPSYRVWKWAGLKEANPSITGEKKGIKFLSLAQANDYGKLTFKEIAKIIEKKL